MNSDILEIYKKTGGLKTGHFQLTSGLHTDSYLQSALVLQYPEYASRIGAKIADHFHNKKVDVVVGPAVGGIILSHVVGKALGCRSIFTERKNGNLIFYRSFEIKPNEKALMVEDVVTTGGSVRETIEVVEKYRGTVVGIGSIVERSGGKVHFSQPYHPLLTIEATSYRPENCPLCQKGEMVTIPGSRGL
ncbi:MAG: orotate phosphoribosyltransferase [Deltaproteobacteria bacterium]|nr:orotate phosphoribosyltransferase [Deltaproteobacteria bacterium]